MSRPARWAISPLDSSVHLQPDSASEPRRIASEPDGISDLDRRCVTGDHLALTARCGHLLPPAVHWHDQPPPGPPCEPCRMLYLAGFEVPK